MYFLVKNGPNRRETIMNCFFLLFTETPLYDTVYSNLILILNKIKKKLNENNDKNNICCFYQLSSALLQYIPL